MNTHLPNNHTHLGMKIDTFAFINPVTLSPLRLSSHMRDQHETGEANMRSQLKGRFPNVRAVPARAELTCLSTEQIYLQLTQQQSDVSLHKHNVVLYRHKFMIRLQKNKPLQICCFSILEMSPCFCWSKSHNYEKKSPKMSSFSGGMTEQSSPLQWCRQCNFPQRQTAHTATHCSTELMLYKQLCCRYGRSGFPQHSETISTRKPTAMWKDKKKRQNQNTTELS